jgi:hypothetical protein
MSARRRQILERVARGELTPEEADELLRRAELEPAEPPEGIGRVKVSAEFGAVVVTADPSVTQVEVDGPHRISVDGDTLVVRSNVDYLDEVGQGFSIHLGGRRRARIKGAAGLNALKLRVRMNPSLPLEVKLDAGSLYVSGVRAPIRARLGAGPMTIEDFSGTIDLAVNAGAVRATGTITGGESRIRNDAGAVRVELDPASSVRIIGEAALGKVVLPSEEESVRRRFGSSRTATVGDGAGTLRVETGMGSINVSVS